MSILAEEFQSKGYAVIPNILTLKEAEKVRSLYANIFEKSCLLTLTPTQFLSEVEMSFVPFRDKVVESIKNIFGHDYVMYPNFTVRQNIYLPWHTDAYFLPKEINQKREAPEFIQCAVYLQDNTKETGGGVNVIPGSHLDDFFGKNESTKNKIAIEEQATPVYSSAGDLVVWDSRITHSSTIPSSGSIPKKLAIQWTVSKSEEFSNFFIAYLVARATKKMHVSDHVGERPIDYFQDMPSIRYPQSFSQEIVSAIKKHNIRFIGINS